MKLKKNILKSPILLLLLVLSLFSFSSALAADEARIYLSLQDLELTVGQTVTVDILLENLPLVYGADVRLTFDPQKLEVIDSDEATKGIQLPNSEFIDSAQSYSLQNQVDNQQGGIDYALTLVNPAEPVSGNGRLTSITFKAKGDGQAQVRIEKGEFGTQTGEVITLIDDYTEIAINAITESQEQPDASATPGTNPPPPAPEPAPSILSTSNIATLIGGFIILLLLIILIIQSRQLKQARRTD